MAVLDKFEPKEVFHYFEELCAVPRVTFFSDLASDYCVEFAKAHGLDYFQDEYKNVIIYKDASPGYEDAPAVILQGHLDMVGAVADGVEHDFHKDPIKLLVNEEEGYCTADGTTLGADNGIAVAMALAILADDEIEHPRLEVLFTIDEETGMGGAKTFDASKLSGKYLINMDSEEEGVLTVSCAGGFQGKVTFPVTRGEKSGLKVRVSVEGLLGGHSGVDINRGRGNANKLMGRFLYKLSTRMDFDIIGVAGGTHDNVIPKSAAAELLIRPEDKGALEALAKEYDDTYKKEFAATDPGISVVFTAGEEGSAKVLTPADKKKFIFLLFDAPQGIRKMSAEIDGLVQTSLNFGRVATEDDNFNGAFCVRSSVASEKQALCDKLYCLVDYLGGSMEVLGDYPAWEYQKESKLRDLMVEVYKEQYGGEPRVEAMHAGLECGIIKDKMGDIDCISAGPDMLDVHSSNERLMLASTERFWKFIKETLKRLK